MSNNKRYAEGIHGRLVLKGLSLRLSRERKRKDAEIGNDLGIIRPLRNIDKYLLKDNYHHTCWICVKEVNWRSHHSVEHLTVKHLSWSHSNTKEHKGSNQGQQERTNHETSIDDKGSLALQFCVWRESGVYAFVKKRVFASWVWPWKMTIKLAYIYIFFN